MNGDLSWTAFVHGHSVSKSVWMKGQAGFDRSVNCELIKEANVREERDKYVVLVLDEIKIREDLIFDKHSCRLIGFGDVMILWINWNSSVRMGNDGS